MSASPAELSDENIPEQVTTPDLAVVHEAGALATGAVAQSVTFEERLDRALNGVEEQVVTSFAERLASREMRQRLAGYDGLDRRRILAPVVNEVVVAQAKRFWEKPSGAALFSQIPDEFITAYLPFYYKKIAEVPKMEPIYHGRYNPIAYEKADKLPQIHLADRLRRSLVQRYSKEDFRTLAVGDLVTIYGISLEMIRRGAVRRKERGDE